VLDNVIYSSMRLDRYKDEYLIRLYAGVVDVDKIQIINECYTDARKRLLMMKQQSKR
jgi:hypothetical protein